jgi:hypothetical protein
MRAFHLACDISAGIGGATLIAMATVTVISVLGRALFSSPIRATSSCSTRLRDRRRVVPAYTQFRHGNIIVDFFTGVAAQSAR